MKRRTGRWSGPVCGSDPNPSPALRASAMSRSGEGLRILPERTGVARHPTTHEAMPKHPLGEHPGRPQRGVAGVVDEHRHRLALRSGEGAGQLHMRIRIGIGVPDPGDAADDVRRPGAAPPRTARPRRAATPKLDEVVTVVDVLLAEIEVASRRQAEKDLAWLSRLPGNRV